MRKLFIPLLLIVFSCETPRRYKSTVNFYRWSKDDLTSPYKVKGGGFSYVDNSYADDSYGEGLSEARNYCQDRKIYIADVSSKDFTFNYNEIIPKTSFNTSTITNNENFNQVTVNNQQTDQVVVQRTSTVSYKYINFLCLDADSDAAPKVFVLFYSRQNGAVPKCVDVTGRLNLGEKRIEAIAKKSDSVDCRERKSYIAYYDETLLKEITLYLGQKGLQLCQKLEEHLVDKDIYADKIEYESKKFIKCSK